MATSFFIGFIGFIGRFESETLLSLSPPPLSPLSLLVLGIVFDTHEGVTCAFGVQGIVFDTREGVTCAFGVLGIVFDTREGVLCAFGVLGFVFDTSEGCGASKKKES